MRGLVNHEKRNLLAITLVYTIVICFILQYVIANDISGTADQINNFYGGIYNDYGNLFLGTLDQYYKMFIIVLMIPVSLYTFFLFVNNFFKNVKKISYEMKKPQSFFPKL